MHIIAWLLDIADGLPKVFAHDEIMDQLGRLGDCGGSHVDMLVLHVQGREVHVIRVNDEQVDGLRRRFN